MSFRLRQPWKNILLYAVGLAAMLLLLQWLEWRLVLVSRSFEIYIAVIAIIFMALGIWLASHLIKGRQVKQAGTSKPLFKQDGDISASVPNEAVKQQLGISSRELEVLQLMADGLSNQEIASRLYVSLNTIKTHNSRLFEKMDVKRRTQAIEKARRLQLIA